MNKKNLEELLELEKQLIWGIEPLNERQVELRVQLYKMMDERNACELRLKRYDNIIEKLRIRIIEEGTE